MDEHALGRLRIGSLDRIPEEARDLSTWAFDRAVEVHYRDAEDSPVMRLVLACSLDPYRDWKLTLELRDIHSLLFPPIGSHLWLPQLEISEIRASNFDGTRYLVSAEEGAGFECYCGQIECVAFNR